MKRQTNLIGRLVPLYGLCLVIPVTGGCIVTAAVLGARAIGERVTDKDVKKETEELVGHNLAEADSKFGPRLQTLTVMDSPRLIAVYDVEPTKSDRWVVESEAGRIVAVSKVRRDADDGRSVIQRAGLDKELLGKSALEIRTKMGFEQATLRFRDRATGNAVFVYDVTMRQDLERAHYCVVEFDGNGSAADLRLVGSESAGGESSIGRQESVR